MSFNSCLKQSLFLLVFYLVFCNDALSKIGYSTSHKEYSVQPPIITFGNPASENPNIHMFAKGTGRTTGHIADISITNKGDRTSNVELGPYYIPASGRYQPYVIPGVVHVEVKPGSTVDVPLIGYCADIRRPPVPAGTAMPDIKTWIVPDIITEHWEPNPSDGWVSLSSLGDGKFVTKPGFGVFWNIPGTDHTLDHVIDQYQHPEEVAGILSSAISRIISTYDSLKYKGVINTPFAGNNDRERESVIQQTFWIYTSALIGDEYTKEQFADKLYEQFESQSGKSIQNTPAEVVKKLDQGVDDFWNTFNLVGVEAKILSIPQNQSSLPDLKSLENAFGKDLSEVKIHSDDHAKSAADSLGAKAYALGDTIVLGSVPSSLKHLAGHEAAHVIQQKTDKYQSDNSGDGTPEAAAKKESKPRCKCLKISGSISTDRGMKESIPFSADPNKSAAIVINYPRVSFDKPGSVHNPEEFTINISGLKLECECDKGPCEIISAKKGKTDNQYGFAITQFTSGVDVDGNTKKTGEKDQSFGFKSKSVASKDITIKFRLEAYCSSDDCNQKFCSTTLSFNFKDDDEEKKEKK